MYENFYRSEKAAVDPKPVKARYQQWKREVGVVTSELLKDKEMLEVVEFLKKKVLRHTPVPSERERCQVDLDMLRSHLPHGYELPEELPNCCARLKRFVTMDGDTLRINYDCYGEYLHQFFYRLTAPERQALIEFDLMLDLIHRDMASLSKSDKSASVEDRIRRCIALLMEEKEGDEPLFCQQSHWQAVYRILVDKGYCNDSDFDGFDVFIRRVMPDHVNKPYKKDSVKQISQTCFNKPFDRWKYDAAISGSRKPYERMVLIATRFKVILEENGL